MLDQAIGLWGAQRCLLSLAEPLAQRGVDLVLGSPPDLALSRAWAAAGLEHVPVALPTLRTVRVDGHQGRVSVRAAARELRREVDVVRAVGAAARDSGAHLLHANGHAVHLDAALAGRIARLPVLLHLHEEMPQLVGTMVRAASVALAGGGLAVSRAVAQGVPGLVRGRVAVLANGVDDERFSPGEPDPAVREALGARPGETLVVALTRLDPEKRVGDVVSALAALAQRPDLPAWHLAVVGETSSFPDHAAEVVARAREMLGDRVTLAGRREDVVEVLRCADVLVHAGVVEGMPLNLLEAQACEVPVVAYRVAGVPEVVDDGMSGLLAAPLDVAGLSAAVARLVADPDERKRMGKAGRAAVEQRSTLAWQATRYAAHAAALTGRSIDPEATS